MSMILDALSRAEKERQSENAVGLDTARYVTSSTIKEDRFKKWVLIALVANFALIILISLGYAWKTFLYNQSTLISVAPEAAQTRVVEEIAQQQPEAILTNEVVTEPIFNQANEQLAPQSISLADATNKTSPVSSLLDEAMVKKNNKVKTPSKKPIKNIVKKIPPVQYSSKPLSAPVQPSKPTVASVTAAVQRQNTANVNTNYTRLSDIPANERSQLSQYQVNVHVYDDTGQGSFVLINMVKYKQGDHLPGGNAYVSSIVPEGVVIDYGSGKALIERNQ
jgi:hypothetical protein